MNFKITKKPTCLAKIRSPVSKNHAVFAILSSLQPIRSLEPSVQPLHVLPLEYKSIRFYKKYSQSNNFDKGLSTPYFGHAAILSSDVRNAVRVIAYECVDLKRDSR